MFISFVVFLTIGRTRFLELVFHPVWFRAGLENIRFFYMLLLILFPLKAENNKREMRIRKKIASSN